MTGYRGCKLTEREAQASAFISRHGWGGAQRAPLAGDASNRRYDRLRRPSGETLVLMDAPPGKGEDVRPFVSVAGYLREIGLSAPRVVAEDASQGFLLLEDLGDDIFARIIEADPALERPLYEAAVDVLTALHAETPPDLANLDAATMTELAVAAFDWYQMAVDGSVDQTARARFCDAFHGLLAPMEKDAFVLIQRDYHAENLIWLPDRAGPARVGLLDFQGAMLGHPAYDLVSVLLDARRDVPPTLQKAMVARYLQQNPDRADGFEDAYALLGVQRNLRIIGVFTRLCVRDHKPHYLDMMPRVWGHIEKCLKHPALETLSPLVLGPLPAPDPAILRKIRAQCPANPTP